MKTILAREKQVDLLDAFITNNVQTAPQNLLIHGPTGTGKSITLETVLKSKGVRNTWISCDECVSTKILWKKVIQGLKVDSGVLEKDQLTYDALATGSFQAFLKQLQEFFTNENYEELHYLVLDRCDQIMEDGEDLYKNFVKIQEVAKMENLCVVFVSSTIPKPLITRTILSVCFDNYTSEEATFILTDCTLCHFPDWLEISKELEAKFWQSYVKLVVESFYTYTTNVVMLKNILIKLWDKFIEPVVQKEVKPHDFHLVYRRNIKLIGSEYAITTSIVDESEDEEDVLTSHLPIISKFLLIAGYLASFNDSKLDWPFLAKLKDYHKKKTGSRFRSVKIDSRLLEPSPFDLERLFAITHALYRIDSGVKLQTTLDLMTQVANLGSMKLLLKSSNVDYIGGKTKWKINCSYDFIKGIANDLSFPIDNYLE